MLLSKLRKKLLFSLVIFFISHQTFAAACCGGGFAAPSIITNDDKAILTTSFSQSKVDTDVFSDGVWQKRSGDDISKILKIESAHIFNDRYQYGFSIPIQTRNKSGAQGGQSKGLGDVAAQVGYEYLPDWDYNPWRPHGVGFISLTLPTGKSIYESDNVSGIDSQGRGFWAIGFGTAFTKSWTNWDANSNMEIHKSFEKTVSNNQIHGVIKPGHGGSFSIGSGYNLKNFRFGSSIAWSYEDAIIAEGDNTSNGSVQRFSTGTLSSSYLFADTWAGTLSYSDQTLFGNPTNTSLSKTLALSVQKRWAR